MDIEIEAMFVGVDHDKLRKQLSDAGASLVHSEYEATRITFDYEDLRLDAKAAWIRLRKEPQHTTLAYKRRGNETIEGMQEVEVVVDDFDRTKVFLESIGLVIKSEQQSKREIWELNGVEVMLDSWPWLDPVVEVEGKTEQDVKQICSTLGLDWSEAIFDSIDGVYTDIFDVTRTEICTVPWRFGPIPEWLEAKRK